MYKAKQYIINWCLDKSYRPQNLFVRKLMDAGFSHIEIKSILEILDNTCLDCFDNNKGCCCEKDE